MRWTERAVGGIWAGVKMNANDHFPEVAFLAVGVAFGVLYALHRSGILIFSKRPILAYSAVGVAAVMLFPPWEIRGRLIGYSFIGIPKTLAVPFQENVAGTVFVSLLAIEIFAVLVIGALLYLAAPADKSSLK